MRNCCESMRGSRSSAKKNSSIRYHSSHLERVKASIIDGQQRGRVAEGQPADRLILLVVEKMVRGHCIPQPSQKSRGEERIHQRLCALGLPSEVHAPLHLQVMIVCLLCSCIVGYMIWHREMITQISPFNQADPFSYSITNFLPYK